MNNSSHADRLSQIRKACGIGPLKGGDLARYWIDTDLARDPKQSVREVIQQELSDHDNDAKILFYGHGGAGKSTELAKLQEEINDRFFIASFSAREEMQLTAVTAEDIIVILMERLVAVAIEAKISISEDRLKPIHQFFDQVTQTREDGRKGTLAASAGIEARTPGFLDQFLKLLASFRAEIKYESGSTTTRVSAIRRRPGDLLIQANQLVESIRAALPPDKRILMIVEDLDKMDIATARQVFIEKANVLTGIHANIIYTIPIFVFHSPDAPVLQRSFNIPVCLPMIKVTEPGGTMAGGADTVKEMIRRRIGSDALTSEAMDLLVAKTGGVLAHAFQAIQMAALMRQAPVPLTREHIEYGLQRLKNEFWVEITLPYTPIEGLKDKKQLFERLAECAKRQRSGQINNPTGDAIDQVLLKCCALVEYNGLRWFGVHPLVQEILEEIGLIERTPNTVA